MERKGRLLALQELLKKEPADVFLNYALALEYQNDPGTRLLAGPQFQKVLLMDENYIAAYYQLGKLLESQNKAAEALAYFKKGLDIARSQNNNKTANEFEEAIFMLED